MRKRKPQDRVLFIRCDRDLHRRVERAQQAFADEFGVPVSLTTAARLLLETALDLQREEEDDDAEHGSPG